MPNLFQNPVADQIGDAPGPGLVRIAADIDAHGAGLLTARHVVRVDVDVEDQVADLLHGPGEGKLGAQGLGDLGGALKNFRKAVKDGGDADKDKEDADAQIEKKEGSTIEGEAVREEDKDKS